ncbi:MAG: hypothetical protein FWG75_03185 [Cystobacterineae bacterium]|nr:hypothetical protein [Cystobacterineae bacterium]
MDDELMDSEIPLQVVAQLFVGQGAVFVDDEQIPEELKARGWRSETMVEEAAEGYEISHLVFEPSEEGEPQCIFKQKMRVKVSPGIDEDGEPINQLEAIELSPGEMSLALEELLAQIEAAKNTLEFEVRF